MDNGGQAPQLHPPGVRLSPSPCRKEGKMQANQQSQSEARDMEERAGVPGMLDLPILEEHCRSEIENDCLADPTNARFSFELLRHATSRDNQEAREAWQRCFGEVLRSWLHRHPRSEEACRFDTQEHYL